MIEDVGQGRGNELAVEHRWPDEEPGFSHVASEDDERVEDVGHVA